MRDLPYGEYTKTVIKYHYPGTVAGPSLAPRRAVSRVALPGLVLMSDIAHKAFPYEPDFAAAKSGIFPASLIAGGLKTPLLWFAAASASGESNERRSKTRRSSHQRRTRGPTPICSSS